MWTSALSTIENLCIIIFIIKGFTFRTVSGRFQSDIMAVKGLN